MTFPAESSQVLGCLCLLLFVEKYKGGVGEGAAVTGSAGALRSSQSSNRAVNPTPQIKINQLASLDQERGPRPSREEEPLSPSLPRCPWGRPGSSGETCEAAVAPWTQPALPLPLLWKFLPAVPAPLVHGPPPARCRRPPARFPGEVSPPFPVRLGRLPAPPPPSPSSPPAARCCIGCRAPVRRGPAWGWAGRGEISRRDLLGSGPACARWPVSPLLPELRSTRVFPGPSAARDSPTRAARRGTAPSRLPGSSLPETPAPAAPFPAPGVLPP